MKEMLFQRTEFQGSAKLHVDLEKLERMETDEKKPHAGVQKHTDVTAQASPTC